MKRVYLVGFMGSGKSTVGRLVADRLGWEFVDLDETIEADVGRSVQEIFSESGERRFREIESDALRRVQEGSPCVVACGGGTYVDSKNRDFIDQSGIAVYLEASLEIIMERVDVDGTRPLFSTPERTAELYQERLHTYRMAGIEIVTDHLTPEQIADGVIRAVRES